MMKRFCKTVIMAWLALACLAPVGAQTDPLRSAVAGLSEDVGILVQQVKAMRLELEATQRENARLREQLASVAANRDTGKQIAALTASLEAVRREFRQADEAQKKQIVSEVSRQIDALATQTQSALDAMSRALNSQPKVSKPVTFSDDYPQTGRSYVVRSGDSLSKIAREFGSTVKHIQNANRIVNPSRDLRVGETIFIPISE